MIGGEKWVLDNEKNIVTIDLREKSRVDVGSVKDSDLLNILCFATHEGINLNGTEFSRDILMKCYASFVDKPLVMVSSASGEPTGHGFNFLTRKFDEKDRKYVGHVKSATPCIVKADGGFTELSEVKDVSEFASAEGEMRVMCELVVYKYYLNEVADTLVRLHNNGNLMFSMEGLMDCAISDDGIRHCTDIQFTGLAIVKKPAFENSYSLEVAEDEKEGGKMDYEKAYNDLKAKYDALLEKYNALNGGSKKEDKGEGSGGSGGSGGGGKKAGFAEIDAEKYTALLEELASVKIEMAELKPYKEAAIAAEKKAVGEKRHAKLEKIGYTEKGVDELAEMSAVEYAELLEASIDTEKPAEKEVGEDNSVGVVFHNSGMKSDFDMLNGVLADLLK